MRAGFKPALGGSTERQVTFQGHRYMIPAFAGTTGEGLLWSMVKPPFQRRPQRKNPADDKHLRDSFFIPLGRRGLGFGLLGLAALHGDGDVGHGGGVRCAMPVVLAGWNQHHVALFDGQGLIVVGNDAGAFGDD